MLDQGSDPSVEAIRLVLDVEKMRSDIRAALRYHFTPLAGKGEARDIELQEFEGTRVALIA